MAKSFLFVDSLEPRRLLAAGFQIELAFETSVNTSTRTILQTAANRWQQIITGDLPDVGAGAWGAAVDDIRITARVRAIDGVGGGVAQARPTYIRATGNKLPIAGEIEIDSADLAAQTANGALLNIVTHEIAHALGFGTIWSQFSGLTTGTGGSNPLFVGTNALREYRQIANNWSLSGVPLENTSGAGTRDVHWREATFGNELLTGFINAGTNPISRVTIGQFADLGYSVNYSAADTYTLPGQTPVGGTLNGTIFNDANRNGRQDAGEAGLSGRTLYIDANFNGTRDASERIVTTDSNGNYSFTALPGSNSYAIRQVLAAGETQTAPSGNNAHWVALSNGQTIGNLNFGLAGTTVTPPPPTGGGTLSGRVFNDANRNGRQDAGETGLGGRTIYVDANYNGVRDASERIATTDSNGNYTFTGLPASNAYAIRQALNSGETQTTPASNNAHWVALSNGQTIGNLNFGLAGTTVTPPPPTGGGILSGRVFNDANRNGQQNTGEAGLSGRTVYIDANFNGVRDASERTTTTDSNGNYTFTDLAASNAYAVRQVLAAGETQTAPSGNNAHWVALSNGQTIGNLNFGLAGAGGTTPTPTTGIGGKVFRDLAWNGQLDANDIGQANVTVFVDTNFNGRLDAGELSTTTDVNGNYRFTTLAAGTYAIRVVKPSSWYQTRPTADGTWWITVSAGQSRSDLDFGFGF